MWTNARGFWKYAASATPRKVTIKAEVVSAKQPQPKKCKPKKEKATVR